MVSVEEYLNRLGQGANALSPKTISVYRGALKTFAVFLKVDITDLHNHLTPQNLINYGTSRKNHKPAGTNLNIGIIRRFYYVNDKPIADNRLDEITVKRRQKKANGVHQDIPLTKTMVQDMMARADVQGKAIISFLISTACRAGETAQLTLSDIRGDIVTIPDEIAKGGHGGQVFLTSEARQYLNEWLEIRGDYLKKVEKVNTRMAKNGLTGKRSVKKDDRVFAVSYEQMYKIFQTLVKGIGVDKTPGKVSRKYGNTKNKKVRVKTPEYNKITLHSCRRYFNTHAEETMTKSLVEYLMRHTGYLSNSYYRNDRAYKDFKQGEHALYINANRNTPQDEQVDDLKKQIAEMQKTIAQLIPIVEQAKYRGMDKKSSF